jgi:hypothetical protein
MKKLILAATLALTALAIPAAASAHNGPPVDVFTDTVTGSAVVPFQGPCGGAPGSVAVEFHDVFHVTAFADGHLNVVGNQTGTFEFEPNDPNEPSSSGRYRQAFETVRRGTAPNFIPPSRPTEGLTTDRSSSSQSSRRSSCRTARSESIAWTSAVDRTRRSGVIRT